MTAKADFEMKLIGNRKVLAGFAFFTAALTFGVTFAPSGEKTNGALREEVVARIREMATIPWTPSEDMVYWNPKFGAVFKKGEHYTGIPYTQRNRQTSVKCFRKHLDKDGRYIGSMDYLGSDCSSSVSNAWRAVDPQLPFLSTHLMFPGMGAIVAVGDYKVTSLDLTSKIIEDNGQETMFAAYDRLKPGDAVLTRSETDGHVRLVSKTAPDNQCIYIIEQSGVSADRRMVGDHSTWRVDREITYASLYSDNYVPIAHKSLFFE
jgi:hypothetical protein